VGDQAKGVFQGKIHIAPNAIKTEGYQLHKAMLLTDEAEVDVKPELEIFADDVKCSHGSACGELDKEQLFYMQSRGISEDNAKRLLIGAYLNDVIAKVDDENIIEWIKLSLNTSQSK
jgi:Fe-S cluster assembly protein SufD